MSRGGGGGRDLLVARPCGMLTLACPTPCRGKLNTRGGHAGYSAAIGFLGEADIDHSVFNEQIDEFVSPSLTKVDEGDGGAPGNTFKYGLALSGGFNRKVGSAQDYDGLSLVRVCT
jgi:hypothetical protein